MLFAWIFGFSILGSIGAIAGAGLLILGIGTIALLHASSGA